MTQMRADIRNPQCIEWGGARDRDGYGKTPNGRRGAGQELAHRWAWEKFNGSIPEGVCVLHRCDNPPCCNPDHLFLGTPVDNVRDRDRKGRNGYSRKTHCPQGHPYSIKNTYHDSRGWRHCRACGREHWHARKRLRRAA